jgi:Recombination endonuclease VII
MTTTTTARAARDKRLRAQFNITADEWDIILAYQNGLCAHCKERDTQYGKNKGKPKPLNTDHDHRTALTRGILCSGCNRKIPSWMTIEWLEETLKYLKNPPAVAALGEERYGRKGRVTNKRKRRPVKKPVRRTKK